MLDPGDLSSLQLDILKHQIGSAAAYDAGLGANVALLEAYMPTAQSPGYKILSNLQGGIINFQQKLSAIKAIDTTENDGSEQVGTGIIGTMEDVDWTPGGSREIIYYTGGIVNRDWNHTEFDEDKLESRIANAAHKAGDVRISAVASEVAEQSDLRWYVDDTDGDFIDNTPWVKVTFAKPRILLASTQSVDTGTGDPILDQMIENDRNRPDIRFELDAMYASPGQELNFDVSRSAADYPRIVRYEWDFDNDGTVDRITTTPQTTYTYDAAFDGRAKVQAYTDNGYSDVATIAVQVAVRKPPVIPQSPTNLKIDVLSTKDNKSSVNLSWKLPDKLPYKYILRVNDYPMGTLTNDRTSVEITDLDRSGDITISLVGIDEDWNEGTPATQVLQKLNGPADGVDPSSIQDGVEDDVNSVDKPGDNVVATDFSPTHSTKELKAKTEKARALFVWIGLGMIVVFAGTAVTYIIYQKRKEHLRQN